MKTVLFLFTGWLLALTTTAQPTPAATGTPATPKRPVTDTYFGKAVVDNYRWLEDMNSPETKAWFKAQGDYTNAVLDQIPGRDKLIETFVDYDKLRSVRYGVDLKRRGNTYFYRKTLPNETVGKLYGRAVEPGRADGGAEVLLFDPTTYEPGKACAVSDFVPSEDGRLLSIGLEQGGGEISTVRILNVATQTLLPDRIDGIFGGVVAWSPDSRGFFYTPLNSTDPTNTKRNQNLKARYHAIGTSPRSDSERLSAAQYPAFGIKPQQRPYITYSEDFAYLLGTLQTVDRRLHVLIAPAADLGKPRIGWKKLIEPEDSVYSMAMVGNRLFLHSVKGAPNGRVLLIDAQSPDVKTAVEVLPESSVQIYRVLASNEYLFTVDDEVSRTSVRQYHVASARWQPVKLPAVGVGDLLSVNPRSNECLLYVASQKQPSTSYRYEPTTGLFTISPFYSAAAYPGVAELVTEQVEVPGHDGVRVPLSLVYRKDLKRNGRAVCLMSGYGAYGRTSTPYFNIMNLALLNQGVVLGVAHVRGGGERGVAWHWAGRKTTKPNTWKDFIACGEYLIRHGYTSANKLIGEGTSAGGIMLGRAITERPDLFAAAINNVGVSNAMRGEQMPSGLSNVIEFGTVKDSTECLALYEMDAMQHVKDGTNYPAVMCVGGMNDPRVIAWQPGKLAAALQNASTSGKPVLMQVNYDNGHFTEDKTVTFRNFANMYAFALWQAGHPDFQPSAGAPRPTKEVVKK